MCSSYELHIYSSLFYFSYYFLFITYNSCITLLLRSFLSPFLSVVEDLTTFYFSKNLQVCIPAYLHYCNILITGITPVISMFVLSFLLCAALTSCTSTLLCSISPIISYLLRNTAVLRYQYVRFFHLFFQ